MRKIEPLPPRRPLPALALSLVIHTCILVVIGLIWKPPLRGTGEESDRPVGIALVKTFADRVEYESMTENLETAAGETNSGDQTGLGEAFSGIGGAPLAGNAAPAPLDIDGMLAEFTATPSPNSGGPSADAVSNETAGAPGQSGSSAPGLRDSGSRITAEMFGVKGYGHRFVYVMDRSDSMNGYGGRPLAAAKRELLRSVRGIGPDQEFQVIFYNERAMPLKLAGQMTQLLKGDQRTHSMVTQVVNVVHGSGGTNHVDAIKLALRMRPDVVFLLTDARVPRMTGYQLKEIQSRASLNETTIHTIEFGTDAVTPNDSFLQELATRTGGEYRYFNLGAL